MCMYVCMYVRTYVCMYVRTYVCMYVYVYVSVGCSHIDIQRVCIYVFKDGGKDTGQLKKNKSTGNLYIIKCVCMYVCICV